MAQALDSAYQWSINPLNTGNLNQQQMIGLGSLAPSMGLAKAPMDTPLNPYANLPDPGFSPNASSYFSFEEPAVQSIAQSIGATGGVSPLAFEEARANVGNPDNAGANAGNQPYFDPNYPYESMLALKNWLTPQVKTGVSQAMHSRGLDYSGVGKYAQDRAQGYIGQLAPAGETGQQALANDFARLYGPNITNSLISGTANRGGLISRLPSSIPDAAPFGSGSTNAQAFLVANQNPNIPAPPQTWQPTPENAPQSVKDQEYAFQHSFHVPEADPIFQWMQSNPSPPPGWAPPPIPPPSGQPRFGLYDLATGSSYATPGYLYDPNQPPDTKNMPWLANATPQSQTAGTSPNV